MTHGDRHKRGTVARRCGAGFPWAQRARCVPFRTASEGCRKDLDNIPHLRLNSVCLVRLRASSRGVTTMEQGAVPAGVRKRTSCARAAPGPRPQALGPAARSSLMVRATCRKADQPPEARPGRRKTPPVERRGAQRPSPRTRHRKVQLMWRLAALHPLGIFRGTKGKAGVPAPLNNRGDDARSLFEKRIGDCIEWAAHSLSLSHKGRG
jgi:hypothetical protein